MLSNKAVDPMTDHRIDMILLAITVTNILFSSLDSSVASSDLTITCSLLYFATSSGSIARTPLP